MKTQHVGGFRPRSLLLGLMVTAVFLAYGAGSSAGIQGSGRKVVAVFGRITALGSIFVNGVEYATNNARIDLDGRSAGPSQLQVGQIVAVQAVLDPNGITGAATSVSFTGDVVGPISQLDLTRRSLTVLGQTIQLDDATLFGEGIQSGGIGSLQNGMIVEASGFADTSGNLLASRIDLVAGVPLQVRGIVQTLDASAQTFRINDLTVDYSGVVPSGKLANGSTATVQAIEFPTGGTLHATRVQASSGIGGTANEQGQVEGLITSFQSADQFYVGDQLVLANSSTHVVPHGKPLAPDLAVKVIGVFAASGALIAREIHVKRHP